MKNLRFSFETAFYLVFWGVLIAAPVIVAWFQMGTYDSDSFNWFDVLIAWNRLLPYIVVFLLHNFLLAPLFLRGRRVYYFLSLAVVVVLFFLIQCQHGISPILHPKSGSMPTMDMGGPPPMEGIPDDSHPREDFSDEPPFMESDAGQQKSPIRVHRGPEHHNGVPMKNGQRELWDTILMVLMLGMNIGVKLYARHREDARRMEELERRNLEQQLAQLRYQVNPHFLMNILNNIHALVDIDPVEAQQAIIELSRLLRYVLYDADRSSVLLRSELDFIQHYVALMRVRYADSVQIDIQLPSPIPEAEVPPLLFITFVENAFKHGVSYQQLSTIKISITLDDESQMLDFTCVNTKRQSTEDSLPGGVGLRNVRQRLNLLYPDCHSLDITDGPELYTVQLKIPLRLNTLDKPA